MKFDLSSAIEILERTPEVLSQLFGGLSPAWTQGNEGPNTWSPYDIVGHFIHGERTDWIPRMEIILSDRADKTFESFDRFAQFRDSVGKEMEELLEEFKALRMANVERMRAAGLQTADFERGGIHPELGPVKLSQLLATWVVHDLNHLAQAARVMAKQYKGEVGPWGEYLTVLK